MRIVTLLLAAVCMLMFSPSSPAGNPARGLEKSEVCQSCHGRDGNLVPNDETPRLAGQYEDYLVHALEAYRSGDRQHAIMNGFAGELSDQDIEDLAAWYARQEGLKVLRIR